MEKQEFKKLIEDLNCQSLKFISLANKENNPYYELFSISFRMVKMEMYLGEFPVMSNLLKISIKRTGCKYKNHKVIDVENHKSIDELLDWYLPKESLSIIFKTFRNFKIHTWNI